MIVELNRITQMFYDYTHLFKKTPHNIKNGDNRFKETEDKIKSEGIELHPFHGKCFPIAKFVYYFFDGPTEENLKIKHQRKQTPYLKFEDGSEATTTHWWIEDNGTIIDIAGGQFMYKGYPVDNFYKKSFVTDFGRPYFGNRGKKSEKYEDIVPTAEVIRFAKVYRDIHGSAEGLDWWIEQYDKHIDYQSKKEFLLENSILDED